MPRPALDRSLSSVVAMAVVLSESRSDEETLGFVFLDELPGS